MSTVAAAGCRLIGRLLPRAALSDSMTRAMFGLLELRNGQTFRFNVPTPDQRTGIFSAPIYDPDNGSAPFPNNRE